MIKMGQSWMRYLKAWIKGQKHPDTPRTIFMNVWECDRVRRALKSRCEFCEFVVSDDAQQAKEIVIKNDNNQFVSHHVCDLCYNVFHALYMNYGLKNRNYFKDIHEEEEEENKKRRGRMGL